MTGLIESILGRPMIAALGWTLLHFTWQGSAVALGLLVALVLGRTWSASLRYVVACSAMLMMIVCPIATMAWLTVGADVESSASQRVAVVVDQPSVGATPRDQPPPPALRLISPTETFTDLTPLGVGAWLVGVFCLALYRAGGWLCVQRLRRRAVDEDDAALLARFEGLRRRMNVARTCGSCVRRILNRPR